jgi:S1-C subfamily serine protease
MQQLRNVVAATPPGTDLGLKVWRGRKTVDVTIKIGEQPENLTAVGMRDQPRTPGKKGGAAAPKPAPEAETKLGLRLADPTEQVARAYGLTDELRNGAVITQVAPNSLAAKAGIRVGEVLVSVEDQNVSNAEQANAALAKIDASQGVRLSIANPAQKRFVFLQP